MTQIPPITLEEAGACARQTDYAHDAHVEVGVCDCGREIRNDINWGDAESFFLEGYERARKIETRNLNVCIHALDRIASDWEHIKRKDMIEISLEALEAVGAWRKCKRGEFSRHGTILKTFPAAAETEPEPDSDMNRMEHDEKGDN